MRIYCPECHSCYEVDESLLPDKGKKLRCSLCGEIFVAKQGIEIGLKVKKKTAAVKKEGVSDSLETMEDKTPVTTHDDTPQNTETKPQSESVSEADIKVSSESVLAEEENKPAAAVEEVKPEEQQEAEFDSIFDRLSKQTEALFEDESKLPIHKKIYRKVRSALGLNRKINQYIWLGGIVGVLMLCLYSQRYDIVRAVPCMNGVYKALGIKAKIPGEGLEFENIVWQDYEEDYVRQLEIRGFIANPTAKDIDLPVLHIEMLTKDTNLLQSKNEVLPVTKVKAGSKVSLAVKLTKPSILTKYIYLTFVED